MSQAKRMFSDANDGDLVTAVSKFCNIGNRSLPTLMDAANSEITYVQLLENEEPVTVFGKLLYTEGLRRLPLMGVIAFLDKGGKINEISMKDIRAFRNRMPLQDARKFGYWPVGVQFLTPGHVQVFLDELTFEPTDRFPFYLRDIVGSSSFKVRNREKDDDGGVRSRSVHK